MTNIGKKAKDIITGFTGTIIQKSWYLNGQEKYGISPACTEPGKLPDTWNFDIAQVQILTSEPVLKPLFVAEAYGNHLGEKATDRITGYTGIATGKVVYLNGCVHYCIEAKIKDNKLEEGQWFNVERIAFKPSKNQEYKQEKTGGPQRSTPPRM